MAAAAAMVEVRVVDTAVTAVAMVEVRMVDTTVAGRLQQRRRPRPRRRRRTGGDRRRPARAHDMRVSVCACGGCRAGREHGPWFKGRKRTVDRRDDMPEGWPPLRACESGIRARPARALNPAIPSTRLRAGPNVRGVDIVARLHFSSRAHEGLGAWRGTEIRMPPSLLPPSAACQQRPRRQQRCRTHAWRACPSCRPHEALELLVDFCPHVLKETCACQAFESLTHCIVLQHRDRVRFLVLLGASSTI